MPLLPPLLPPPPQAKRAWLAKQAVPSWRSRILFLRGEEERGRILAARRLAAHDRGLRREGRQAAAGGEGTVHRRGCECRQLHAELVSSTQHAVSSAQYAVSKAVSSRQQAVRSTQYALTAPTPHPPRPTPLHPPHAQVRGRQLVRSAPQLAEALQLQQDDVDTSGRRVGSEASVVIFCRDRRGTPCNRM